MERSSLNPVRKHPQADRRDAASLPFDIDQWLHFWNDEISESENLRDLEYWLEQARQQQPLFL